MGSDVTLDEAVAIAREIAESLGGRQARAIEVLIRHAERGRRLSATALMSVGTAAQSAQHFVRAKEELEKGIEEIQATTRTIARVAVAQPDDRKTDPPPPIRSEPDPGSSEGR